MMLCGGACEDIRVPPKTLRDVFVRSSSAKLAKNLNYRLAEEIEIPDLHQAGYRDILAFERDLAQISKLIVLFSESYGSAAELGAFATDPDIADKLLVVIDDFHYEKKSFVKFGPLQRLTDQHGLCSVCVLNRDDINIRSVTDINGIDTERFTKITIEAINERIKETGERTTFDRSRTGHLIKLIVGLIQHYGALTIDELDLLLFFLDIGIDKTRIRNFLFCAEFCKWVVEDRRGVRTYYASIAQKEAFQDTVVRHDPDLQKTRWRAAIREAWSEDEPNRFSCIQAATRKGAIK